MTKKTCNVFKHFAFHDGSLEGFNFTNGKLTVTISDAYLYPSTEEELFFEKGEVVFTGVYSVSLNGFEDELTLRKNLESQEAFSFDIDTVEQTIITPERKRYTFKLLSPVPSSESAFGYAELIVEAKNITLYY